MFDLNKGRLPRRAADGSLHGHAPDARRTAPYGRQKTVAFLREATQLADTGCEGTRLGITRVDSGGSKRRCTRRSPRPEVHLQAREKRCDSQTPVHGAQFRVLLPKLHDPVAPRIVGSGGRRLLAPSIVRLDPVPQRNGLDVADMTTSTNPRRGSPIPVPTHPHDPLAGVAANRSGCDGSNRRTGRGRHCRPVACSSRAWWQRAVSTGRSRCRRPPP